MRSGQSYRARKGVAIPVVKATLQIGDVKTEAEVPAGAKEVVLKLNLKAGKQRMTALFKTRDGKTVGAYYAYVKKL